MTEADYDAIAAFVFRQAGAESVRELFKHPEHCFFSDEITTIGDKLAAHGLSDCAKVFYEMAPDFPQFDAGNPYHPGTANHAWWEAGHKNLDSQRLEQRANNATVSTAPNVRSAVAGQQRMLPRSNAYRN